MLIGYSVQNKPTFLLTSGFPGRNSANLLYFIAPCYGAPCVCFKKHDTQDYDSLCTFFKTHKKVASECLESQCENSKASINIIRDAEVRSTTTSLRQNE